MNERERFSRAIDAIDAVNTGDPNVVSVRGRTAPKELIHAQLVSEWVRSLHPDASEPLLLAAHGHHLRRWSVPRSSAPAGRAGYLRWRKALQAQHAAELGALLTEVGYDETTVARVQSLVRKEGLGRDPEAQVLEDALCLVFLETQLADVAARLEPDVLVRVLARTADKMSDRGRAAIARVPLDATAQDILERALGPAAPVHRYLDGLRAHDWDAITATLAPDVERIGPYGDDFRGRDDYTAFLRRTIDALSGYELVVSRVLTSSSVVTVELHETVDDGDARLRTDEAVVFDIDGSSITRIAVYLRQSRPV